MLLLLLVDFKNFSIETQTIVEQDDRFSQVAFILNRNIAENVLLAKEVVHTSANSRKKKVEEGRSQHRSLGISLSIIIKLVYHRVSTGKFTLLLNGGKCPTFISFRDLR